MLQTPVSAHIFQSECFDFRALGSGCLIVLGAWPPKAPVTRTRSRGMIRVGPMRRFGQLATTKTKKTGAL